MHLTKSQKKTKADPFKKIVESINKKGSDLNKALAVGFIRNFLGEDIVKRMFDKDVINIIDAWLNELLQCNKSLPIFIYFI